MKIAFVLDAKLRPSLISDKVINQMKEFAEVSLLAEDKCEKEAVKKVIEGADIAVTSWGSLPLDKEILDCAPNLKLIAHAAGSVKPIVTDDLFARDIRLISSASVLSRGVSETALGFTISASKNFYNLNTEIHNGEWPAERSAITELFDITIGVVGCGFAGLHYIELLKPFEIDIIAYDPFVSAEKLAELGARKVELDELFKQSDIISLHAPSIPSTNHMVNAETLKMMKDNVILINTARGTLIDEKALYEHMKSGKVKYACLDVTDPEPPAADNPLRTLPNCIMTPHLAGLANNGQQKIGTHVLREINRFRNNEPLHSEVTKEQLATIA